MRMFLNIIKRRIRLCHLLIQKKFRYVLVDEYQDTNHMQYLLTSLLAGGYQNICVVGDDDQSIYRFRGATIENILDFEKQYKGAKVIRLEQNYRSTQSILSAANEVISHNVGRKGEPFFGIQKYRKNCRKGKLKSDITCRIRVNNADKKA